MTLPPRIARLAAVAAQPRRRIAGLMSGTSLDGLDIALCSVAGSGTETQVKLEHFATCLYSPEDKMRLRAVVSREQVSLAEVCVLNAWLAELHGRLVLQTLAEWGVAPAQVDLLASHGQTVFHAPASWSLEGDAAGRRRHATLQLGDGDLLAVRTGIATVSDFRQKEIAGGGQGAPLAPYADGLLFGGAAPRILLNLGGIANFTWLPSRGEAAPRRSGDTGPANTLLDLAARRTRPDGPGYDPDGSGAARGRVHAGLLARLKAHPYFALPCPKSTGPETFGEAYLSGALETARAGGLSGDDLLATLTRLTVDTIAAALRREVPRLAGAELFITGGGEHNRTLVAWLQEALPEAVRCDPAALGVHPDAKEAVLFAVLANETVAGAGWPAADGSARRLSFGKLSFPD